MSKENLRKTQQQDKAHDNRDYQVTQENPQDGTGYQYFKYYMLVKYLLEHDKLSVDDLFNRDIDVQSLEAKVLKSL